MPRVAVDRAGEDPLGDGERRVADRGLQHEAVELRLGQLVGSRLLDGVLRRDHEERTAHLVGDAVHRDARLLHDLQQRRLRLRRGAVDLVGEHDRGEDRAPVELEPVVLLVVDRDAVTSEGSRSGVNWMRVLVPCTDAAIALARLVLPVRGVLEQHVALSQHRREHEADDLALAEQRLIDVVDETREGVAEPRGLFGGHAHSFVPCRR
jgi:hypothetical protein